MKGSKTTTTLYLELIIITCYAHLFISNDSIKLLNKSNSITSKVPMVIIWPKLQKRCFRFFSNSQKTTLIFWMLSYWMKLKECSSENVRDLSVLLFMIQNLNNLSLQLLIHITEIKLICFTSQWLNTAQFFNSVVFEKCTNNKNLIWKLHNYSV